jgi:hypothetical protein
MAEPVHKPLDMSVDDFIDAIDNETKRDDSRALIRMMSKVTGAKPRMWGGNIIGFGSYHYKYDSGHEGDACLIGFSPRKAALSIYLVPGFAKNEDLLERLGKHKTAVACLYIKKLDDIDTNVLEELVVRSVEYTRENYPTTL